MRSRFLALRGAIERFTADLERVLSEDAHFLSEKLELKFLVNSLVEYVKWYGIGPLYPTTLYRSNGFSILRLYVFARIVKTNYQNFISMVLCFGVMISYGLGARRSALAQCELRSMWCPVDFGLDQLSG